MSRIMYTASNTMTQLQQQIDVIGNNLANSDTNGYKRGEASFSELLNQHLDNQPNAVNEIGRLTPLGIRQGNGARIGQIQNIFTQGSLRTTSRDLDIALTKPNLMFMVGVADDNATVVRYTRDGAFYLSPINNNQTMLVTAEGNSVLDENGNPIVITGSINEISVSEEGVLTAATEGNGNQSFNLGIVSVQKPQFLEKIGGNLFGLPANMNELGVAEGEILTELTGAGRTEIAMKQGMLESSNVDMGKEMTDLIMTQRLYQFQSRSISIGDQMLGLVNTIR